MKTKAQGCLILDIEKFPSSRRWDIVRTFGPLLWGFKFGASVIAHGAFVTYKPDNCVNRFVDLKFLGIPSEVYGWTKAAASKTSENETLISVHAMGGEKMIREAVRAAREYGTNGTQIVAITKLTSNRTTGDTLAQVDNLARVALEAGVHAIVCSGEELSHLRTVQELASLKRIVAGIRDPEANPIEGDDQKRTISLLEAVGLGADYCVLGRMVSSVEDPIGAIHHAIEEVNQCQE